jgi:hypothetical protein
LTQLRKLFRIFRYSLIQRLHIFGAMEGICFEFTNMSSFWKFEKSSNWAGPIVSVRFKTVRRQSSDRGRRGNHCHYFPHHRLFPAIPPPPDPPSCRGEVLHSLFTSTLALAPARSMLCFCSIACLALSHSHCHHSALPQLPSASPASTPPCAQLSPRCAGVRPRGEPPSPT